MGGAGVRYVYLIAGPNGLFKIGQTYDPERRLKWLARAAVGLTLVASVPTTEATRWERYLHEAFAHRRVAGEWFRLTPDDVEAFRLIATDQDIAERLSERHKVNAARNFRSGESGAGGELAFLARAPQGTERNLTLRVPKSFARSLRLVAMHRRQSPAEYFAQAFGALLDEDEKAMQAEDKL